MKRIGCRLTRDSSGRILASVWLDFCIEHLESILFRLETDSIASRFKVGYGYSFIAIDTPFGIAQTHEDELLLWGATHFSLKTP